jgi:hypothetical protein
MPIPLFSVGFYTEEKIGAVYTDLSPEEAYNKISENVIGNPEFRTCGRDEIFKVMATILTGESFRAVWHDAPYIDKYILITKTGFRYIPVSISPDSLSQDQEEIISLGADKELSVHFINNIVTNPSVVQRISKVKLPNSPDSDDENKTFNYILLCSRNMRFFVNLLQIFMEKKPLLPV